MALSVQHQESSTTLTCLPIELLGQVISSLHNSDIKNLRETCTFFHKIAQLRLNRVFLSTNPRDIQVFTAVAEHDVLRLGVQEIIYDDARFWNEYATPMDDWLPEDDELQAATGIPSWYRYLYDDDVADAKDSFETGTETCGGLATKEVSETLWNVEESYKNYQELLQGQTEVISQGRDIDALRFGLLRFPNLRRVTLTILTHGKLSEPFYYTPTIRALPSGLIYPLARGWPGTDMYDEELYGETWGGEKEKWRGFCVLTHGIAEHIRENPATRISEFSIEVDQILAGISLRLFDDTECSEYKDLITVLSYPGFRRFDLPLDCTYIWGRQEWAVFHSRQFHDLPSNATDLQHISLSTNMDFHSALWEVISREERRPPLRCIFPIDKWSNLRHFSLSRFFVKQEDAMDFLGILPPTLKSLELSHLEFVPWYAGSYRGLFEEMRRSLGWRERAPENQPKIVVFVEGRGSLIDVSFEVEDYLYNHGNNPFTVGSNPLFREKRHYVFSDVGTKVDVLSPGYKRLEFPIYD
ncbi:unnamed protein product [Fusarium langsethiae]|nr:unnamed protein product [Fusarium langsethiae]